MMCFTEKKMPESREEWEEKERKVFYIENEEQRFVGCE